MRLKLWFWFVLDDLLMALPYGVVARSVRLRRLQRWVLTRFALAAADDIGRMAAKRRHVD